MGLDKLDMDAERNNINIDAATEEAFNSSADSVIADAEMNLDTEPRQSRISSSFRKFFSVAGIVTAILLMLFTFSIIFWKPLSEFLHLNDFKSPREHFVYVETKAANELANSFAGAYGKYLAEACSEQSAVHYDLQIELGDQLIDSINGAVTQDKDIDGSWIKDISVSVVNNRDMDKYYTALSLRLGEYNIITPSYYGSNAKDKVWMCIPEISNTYLEMNADAKNPILGYWSMENLGIDAQEYTSFLAALPSEQIFVQLLRKYSDIIIHQITDVKGREGVLRVGDLRENCTILTATISERQWIKILISVLQIAQEDELLDGLYEDLVRFRSDDSINQELRYTDKIFAVLEELNAALDQADEENYIQWIDYVSGTDQIIGRRIRFSDAETEFYYALVFDNNMLSCEFDIFDMISGFGCGELSGIMLDGKVDICVDQTQYYTVEIEGINCRNLMSGRLVGNFRVTTYGDQADNQVYDLEVEEQSDGLFLELIITSEYSSSTKLTLKRKLHEPKSIQLPDEVLSAYDENDLAKWLQTCNLEPLIKNLELADVPDDITARIKAYWLLLSYLQS